MALARPSAKISLDGRALTSAEAALVSVDVWSALDGRHDAARLVLWRRSKLKGARVGAALSVTIDGEDVWAGEVAEVTGASDAVQIDGLSTTVALSRRRVSQTFLDQSIADIVRELAGSVTIADVDAPTSLPAYSVDDRRPVWSHLRDLAVLAGAELSASGRGELSFVPPRTGPADAALRYAAELLAFAVGSGSAVEPPAIAAYGAGSEEGSEKWHWLLREPHGAGGGSGPLLALGALRTKDAAETTGRGISDRAKRATTRGRLACVGDPVLRAGSLVELSDLPDDLTVPTLRLTSVHQRLDAAAGFITSATVEAAGGAGP